MHRTVQPKFIAAFFWLRPLTVPPVRPCRCQPAAAHSQRARRAGIKKATGKPIIQVAMHSGRPCIFQFASLEDREALLATLIPLKDEAAKARPAAPAQSSLVPSDAVKAKVFEMHPHLADLHKRHAPPLRWP